jgi:membrane protein
MEFVKHIWDVVQKTVYRWSRNDGNLLAASMAYYAAFSFFPLMFVLINALGYALRFSRDAQSARQQLIDLLAQNTAPSLAQEVDSMLTAVQQQATFNSWIGALILMVAAIGIFSQLETAFDRLWHAVTPHGPGIRAAIRNALWNRLKAFLSLVGLGAVVILAFVADVVLTAFRRWGEEEHLSWTTSLVPWLHVGTSVLINALVFSLIYKMIPRVSVRWRHAFIGGAVVAAIWQIGSQLISRFLVGGRYTAYGVIGSFIIMMLWVYCASILLFLGAQLVQVLGHPEENSPPGPAPPIAPTPPAAKP